MSPKDAAIEGVKSGEYYAAIIIPQDFSESLLSVLSGKIETPELEYYINEKLNAIAPKITSSGASTIQTQVNNTFSSVASETIAETFERILYSTFPTLLIPQLQRYQRVCLPKQRTIFKEYAQLLEKFQAKGSADTSNADRECEKCSRHHSETASHIRCKCTV